MLTPSDTATADLPRRLRGYDRAEVDRVLAELAADRQALWNDSVRLRDDLGRLEQERADAVALETELRETLVSAQRETDARRRAAEAEREEILAAARARAEEGLAALAARRAEAEEELESVRGLDREFRSKVSALVQEALDRLGADVTSPLEPERPPEAPPERPAVTALAAAAAPSVEDDTDSIPIFVDPPEFVPPAPEAAPPIPSAPPSAPPAAPPEPRTPFLRPFLVSAAIVVVGAGVAVGIWQLAADGKPAPATTATPVVSTQAAETAPAEPEPTSDTQSTPPAPETTEAPVEQTPAPPVKARFAVSAVGGDAWLHVREGSASGKLLFEGFLYDGDSRRFVARRVWMRIGDPTALVVRVNGKRVRDLPPGTADLVVTPEGVRNVSLG